MMFFYEDGGLTSDMYLSHQSGTERFENVMLVVYFCLIVILGMACAMAGLNLPEHDQIENENKPKMDVAPNPGAEFLDRIKYRGKIPSTFICPITLCIMHDPVCIDGGHDSHIFERSALEKWMNEGNRKNPLTGEVLPYSTKLIPAKEVAQQINRWLCGLRRSRLSSSIRLQGGGGTLRPKSKSKITISGEKFKRSTSSFPHH